MTGGKRSPFENMLDEGLHDVRSDTTRGPADPPARAAVSQRRSGGEAPAGQAPTDAPARFTRVVRENMNVRVQPELRRELDQLVNRLRSQGWNIRHHHVLEHLLAKLQDEAFVQNLCDELADTSD